MIEKYSQPNDVPFDGMRWGWCSHALSIVLRSRLESDKNASQPDLQLLQSSLDEAFHLRTSNGIHSMKSTISNIANEKGGRNIIRPLEGLRGYFALTVATVHLSETFHIDCQGLFIFLKPFALSFESVLGFFLLSGIVIMRAHKNDAFNEKSVRIYFLKRIRRLYGIYLVALLLTWCLNRYWYTGGTSFSNLMANLFMIQKYSTTDHWRQPFMGNLPLWSLAFEAAYYLAFPVFMYMGYRLGYACMSACIIILLTLGYLFPIGWDYQIASMVQLGAFWWLGACMASDWFEKHFCRCNTWIAWFSFALLPCIHRYSIEGRYVIIVLAMVPLFSIFVLSPVDRERKKWTWILEMIPVWIVLYLIYSIWSESRIFPDKKVVTVMAEYLAFAVTIAFLGLCMDQYGFLCGILNPLIQIGSISYAFYLIHSPVIHFGKYLFDRSPSFKPFEYLFIGGSFILALILAWAIETYFQPIWSKRFKTIPRS